MDNNYYSDVLTPFGGANLTHCHAGCRDYMSDCGFINATTTTNTTTKVYPCQGVCECECGCGCGRAQDNKVMFNVEFRLCGGCRNTAERLVSERGYLVDSTKNSDYDLEWNDFAAGLKSSLK